MIADELEISVLVQLSIVSCIFVHIFEIIPELDYSGACILTILCDELCPKLFSHCESHLANNLQNIVKLNETQLI